MNIEEWRPECDVTMKDVIVHGIVDDCVKIANDAIQDVIDG